MSASVKLEVYVSSYCKQCGVVLRDLAALDQIAGRSVTVVKRDVLSHLEDAVAAGVRATPTLMLNGRLLASGAISKARLRKLLSSVLSEEVNDDADHQ